MKKNKLDPRSLILGMAAGAGAALAGNYLLNRDPDKRFDQRRVNRVMDGHWREAHQQGPIQLGSEHRYIIFSDHHKGARTRADAFKQCEQTYLAALDHYYEQGFTLILLGDAEELLEESIERVLSSYENVLRSEARFHPSRLMRIFGNHDLHWQVEELVQEFMEPYYPGIHYRQSIIFEYRDGEQTSGEIFLIHGHQGTLESDIFSFAARMILPYYRNIQILTGLGSYTTPAQDACLRSLHDNRMYRWASKKSKLILIAGHTHRPVWSAKTHLEKLNDELHDLVRLSPEQRPEDYAKKVLQLKSEIQARQEADPPCADMIKTRPCYFNSGCCQYGDGDITGIEIENGALRLIKWGGEPGEIERTTLEERSLADVFLYL